MSQKERMILGLPYKSDSELSEDLLKGRDFCFKYNNMFSVKENNQS